MKLPGLTRDGALAAALLGVTCALAGVQWLVILFAFYVTGTLLSRVGAAAKLERTSAIADKGGDRDAWQVLANGGVFAGAALASIVQPSTAWMVVAAGAVATSAADTWATEVGTLSSRRPRSILTWREVPAGTSGAITPLGTAAGVAGASFIALLTAMLGWPGEAVCAAVAGGLAGSTIDSVIGAACQSRRWCDACGMETERRIHVCSSRTRHSGGFHWLDNDSVNAMSTIGGAAVGGLCLL